jgi:hypothetical protein
MTKFSKHLILLTVILLSSGCASTRQPYSNAVIPVLLQDELIRPYIKLGRIQVTRDVYVADYLVSPDIKAWGLAAIRQEAEKMGADAIMLPEITGRTTTNSIIPTTEYRATGFAIKFK